MSPSPPSGVTLTSREGLVAAACCIGNRLADALPAFVMSEGGTGSHRSECFTQSFLRLQRKFRNRAEQLQQRHQQQQQEEAARGRWAKPLYCPDIYGFSPEATVEAQAGEGEGDLNIDGVISALLERSGAAASPSPTAATAAETTTATTAAASTTPAGLTELDSKQFADVEPLSNEQLLQQLRLQLLAARYLQQGVPPPPDLMHAIASSLPNGVREEMTTRPVVMLQLSKQLRAYSREHVLQQLEERKRLLDCVLSDDPKIRERFEHICSLPDTVRRQALLERRLCSLSAFQQRLRRNILREAQQQSLPLAELLLEPQAPRSVHEQALSCGCCCISCCKGRPPNAAATSAAVADDAQASAARVAGGATTGGTTAAGTTPATVTATVGLPTPATTTGATGTAVLPFPVSCCGCCCDTSCASFAASTAPSSVVSSCVSTAPAGPQQGAAARAALFAALDPLGLADVEGSELAQKAQRARAVAASAVRSVFSSANLRCCLYTPSERREQQLRLAWERVVQQQAGSLHRQWRRQREEAAALAAEAASQVAQIEQMKLVIREKEQKERMRLLKENDLEAYTKLVKQTKNERLQELLTATEEFLESLGRKVQVQKMETDKLLAQSQPSGDGGDSTTTITEGPCGSNKGLGSRDRYYTLSHAVREEVRQPESLVGGTLMPYQMAGLQWMLSLYNNNLHGILADEMGLGKTIQTIALLAYLKEFKNNGGPHLIIVPLSTLSNWADEFERWAPSLKVMLFKGARLERRQLQRQLKQIDFNVCLTTFDLAIRERSALATPSWRHLVVDEGHRMKNSKSKFHLSVSSFSASHRLLLTGTPLQNNLTELWSLLNFLLPKIFSCAEDFEKWFSQPFEVHGMSVEGTPDGGSSGGSLLNEEEQLLVINRLHAVLRPFLLRRVKKDVLKDMPDKKEYLVHIPLTEWQRLVYKNLQDKGLSYAREFFSKRSLHNTLMQLRKIANHPYLFVDEYALDETLVTSSGKFECLDRMLPKLIHFKHKTLIFSQMTQVLDLMADYLDMRGIKHERLDGSVGLQERKERIDSFNQKNEDAMVFMLSTRAGGLGLNLQAADTVILFDSDFNPHQDLQAMCRAHRVGQTKQVKVFRLVTISGVEEVILQRANKKLSIDQKVIQAGMFDNKSSEDTREEKLRLLLLLGKSTGTDAKATTPLQLNRILSRSEEEFEWFNEYDKKLLGVDSDGLCLGADRSGSFSEQQALYEPPLDEEEEEAPQNLQDQPQKHQQELQQQQQQQQDQQQQHGTATPMTAEGEEEVKNFLEEKGRIIKAKELPDWVLAAAAAAEAAAAADAAAAAEVAAEAEAAAAGELDGAETSWLVTSRKRRNISRPNYTDGLSESKYLKLVDKYENGELAEEDFQEALAKATEKAVTRRRQKPSPATSTTGGVQGGNQGGALASKRKPRRSRLSRGTEPSQETATNSNDATPQHAQENDDQQQHKQQQRMEMEMEESPAEQSQDLDAAS
ncbi:SNF2 family N-terminal domain-containing protein, putative [Eimeria tenella]|uniref:SNF2 family N-terminal domain-containing protein, putative n=1 Tax=Eimeria tenella TaxID=5802 RepID=U6L5N9_EIMTE|nr:SNF2 family N-terminal domain-containing protein, putative [Eimeria tenella]CDJ43110.1 SNF2 family N-terminal domain-containing protein, putative [Eimeria tenella]|eukprot:XP_013233860.1 SNF2 family N-terminal domain-containing protein, putative [Eimeria tenella]